MKQPAVSKTTEGIEIRVVSEYVADRSDPRQNRYFFAYHIEIENRGESPAQLLTRHWVITNAWGLVEEVEGPGVVGLQPRLRPGQVFQYSSFCPLNTPFGTMTGTFSMVRDDGKEFKILVPEFKFLEPAQSVRPLH